jgi:tetraacyldisaccharide 4'-kinase
LIAAMAAALARRRRATYIAHPERRRRLGRPVVSIGNLSLGGTGKTPLVAHVVRLLQHLGHRPSVLSRGYGRPRPMDGVVVVSDGSTILASFDTAGDEPLMLARQLPGCAVVVAADRYVAGALAERRLACTVHVLDDGFQHLRLERALDVVVVTGRDLEDRVMPAGRLREPVDVLTAADAVVVNAAEDIDPRVRAVGARRVFRMTRRIAERREERVLAFAGLGRPDAFFDMLQQAGWNVAGRVAFADHRRYSRGDLERLAAEASRVGARALVTTEKDAARLDGIHEASLPILSAALSITVDPHDDFVAMLRQTCGEGAP